MEKKGELSANQLIAIIILIVSFAVIIIFIVNLNLKTETEKQSCRNSVTLRGTPVGGSVKLDCKTQNVCISKGAKCDEASDTTITVNGRTELLDELTNLMYDCWWQMGEGKVNYLPENLGANRKYCAICDIVHFGDDLKADDTMNQIPVKDLYLYMKNKKVGDTDMLYAFYGLRDMSALRAGILSSTDGQVDIDTLDYNFTKEEGYMLSTSLSSEGWGLTLGLAVGGAVLAAAIAIPTAGFSLVAAGAAIGSGSLFGGAGYLVSGPGGTYYAPPAYYVYEQDVVKALECYEFSSLA